MLSVLLPVHNAHQTLDAGVTEMLEVLPELTGRFELWILDDGSTDDTAEVARELAARYPQVRVLRHPVRLGLAEAIQTGLDHTHGEVILIGDEGYSLDPDDLRTLWQLRDAECRLTNRMGGMSTLSEPWMARLLAWRPRRGRDQRGFQIVRRSTFEQHRLRQASEMIGRVDRGVTPQGKGAVVRPNFMGKSVRASRRD